MGVLNKPKQTGLFGDMLSTRKSLKDRFIMSPFSVLDARQGEWQDRKRSWIALGIDSEVGRGDNLLKMSKTAQLKRREVPTDILEEDRTYTKTGSFIQDNTIGKNINYYEDLEKAKQLEELESKGVVINPKNTKGKFIQETIGEKYGRKPQTGTSIFDPVLCELLYMWFSTQGDKTLDPFAGGSVRGIVGAHLGRNYHGVDLRPEQIEANDYQYDKVTSKEKLEGTAQWYVGDSMNVKNIVPDQKYDFILSCPPYGDLEVYSDDPQDLSNMPYDEFLKNYKEIIKNSVEMLDDNRFAAWVVGEIRDKKTGLYRNFVGETVKAFEEAGMKYYNEIILVTAIGTLPIRVGNFFRRYRKIGKTHQNVLIFYKGDTDKIPTRYPEDVLIQE